MKGKIYLFTLIFLISLVSAEKECKERVEIQTNKETYTLSEKVVFYNKINSSLPFEIEYWIENNAGMNVKKPAKTKNLAAKSFTPKNGGVFILKNKLLNSSCKSAKKILVLKQDYLKEKFVKKNETNFPETPERNINNTEIQRIEYNSSGKKAKEKSAYILCFILLTLMFCWIGKYGIFNKSNRGSARISPATCR